ncbi:hypothetical protein FZ934_08375 [Rhizobium grahamii]|uniref:DNA topoisomerase type IA zn finger domain-containing protein n=1 Tax=Rhizobium grahamii TaxID=1120045 RepID=A0A5Q0C3I4_9HYPH|nr:hypothetical protein FZ934_08375 [Rhizobium grahamii]QRM50426.1 hypothetical protein F3Y33_14515 [Rhizobium sp. BG6]
MRGGACSSCPICNDGGLVDRSGRYGNFLGCIRYPQCTGNVPKSPHKSPGAKALRGSQLRQAGCRESHREHSHTIEELLPVPIQDNAAIYEIKT